MQSLMLEIGRLLSLPGVTPDRVRKIKSLIEELLVRSEQNGGSRESNAIPAG
jgi:hypothetical protein